MEKKTGRKLNREVLSAYISSNLKTELQSPQAYYAIERVKGLTAKDLDISFGQKLDWWLETKGIRRLDFYISANVSGQWVSNVISGKTMPKKTMAEACTIGLELNIDEAEDLLNRAGYTFSQSNLTDVIVKCYIENEIWDIYEINDVLLERDLVPLGMRLT